jgi:eukaryotic-like serine/threonine-protein kinase
MASRVSGRDLLVGLELGHYHVVEKIGAGGMGEVYRARDQHLARDVAIKVLPPGTLNESARKRFRKEALILSQLNHPNVATVYDFDTEHGMDFLVMEYIPGITLGDKLACGPLPEKGVLHLGVQLAEGLAAAHDHAVVHCDVKPGNLRVTDDEQLKILDFGLARLRFPASASAATESLGETQSLVGTLPYMAPEQLLGKEIDARTDIHAAGLVVYEMATGQRPFTEVDPSQLIGAILHRPPLPPTALKPGLSPELERIIGKCLEKEPDHRYRSAKELAVDLRRLASPATSGDSTPARVPASKKWKPLLAAFAGLTLLAMMVIPFTMDLGRIRTRKLGHGGTGIQAIAVLPLENLSRDQGQEYLLEGITDGLITELARTKDLRVISRASVMHYKGTKKTLPQIARDLNVDAIVEGSASREGNHLHLTVQLIHEPTDTRMWAESYDREANNFWDVPHEVAHAITSEIKTKPPADDRASWATTHSASFASYDAYLKGRYYLQQGTEDAMREARTYFEEAVRIDPNYAPAYVGLADYYSLTNELLTPVTMRKAKEYAQKAIAMDDGLADAHLTLAFIRFYGDWNWEGAAMEFKRALQLRPSYAAAHLLYADFLSEMGQFVQARMEIRAAQELDPVSASTILAVGWVLFYARDYNGAVEQCRNALALDPRSVSARDCVASTHLATAAYEQAIAEYSSLATLTGNDPLRLASLGCAYALAGKKIQAQTVLGQLRAASGNRYVAPYFFASIHAALGDNDKAFSWLEKAYQEHDSYLVRLRVAPAMDPLRSDVRFQELLRRMNL